MSRSNKDREKVADHQQDMFLIKTRQKCITNQQGFTVLGIAWLTLRSTYLYLRTDTGIKELLVTVTLSLSVGKFLKQVKTCAQKCSHKDILCLGR